MQVSAGHDSADSSYYSKSNGFEIECVYDVITGAYVGDLVLCAPTAQTGKDLTPSPLPPLFSPKAEVNPYVVCK